jgi:hypothetical protein
VRRFHGVRVKSDESGVRFPRIYRRPPTFRTRFEDWVRAELMSPPIGWTKRSDLPSCDACRVKMTDRQIVDHDNYSDGVPC